MKTLPEAVRKQTEWLNPDYYFHRPATARDGEAVPLVIFLHGKGKRGTNLEVLKQIGPPKHITKGTAYPFAVLAPQCLKDEEGKGWWNIQDLQRLLRHVMETEQIDPKRIYLTGNSMGGFGTWAWASNYPRQFAAIAPVCGGGGSNFKAKPLKELPIWVFHGARDRVVPLKRSEDLVDALKAVGSDVKFTIYPKVKHDAWTPTYANPELYEWMMAQTAPVGFK